MRRDGTRHQRDFNFVNGRFPPVVIFVAIFSVVSAIGRWYRMFCTRLGAFSVADRPRPLVACTTRL
jgi:hypothetical protein